MRNDVSDPLRIAAQVGSGIGVLEAAIILLRGEVVKELTTAASRWAVAGMAREQRTVTMEFHVDPKTGLITEKKPDHD